MRYLDAVRAAQSVSYRTFNILQRLDAEITDFQEIVPANEADSGIIIVQRVTKTLTDAQIKTLPTDWQANAPVAIIPPTEPALNYLTPASRLFVPLFAFAALDNGAGVYGNMRGDGKVVRLRLVWGRDWSISVGALMGLTTADATTGLIALKEENFASLLLGGGGQPRFSVFTLPGGMMDGTQNGASLNDNGLYIIADNGADGAFTGGDPANTLNVTVLYAIVDV